MSRTCHQGHPLSWADERFGCAECGRRRVSGGHRIAYALRGKDGCGSDYREDLARTKPEYMRDPRWKPGMGDPEAYVDGPRAVKKLLDKRKREGWTVDPDLYSRAMAGPTEPTTEDSERIIRQAYEAAAAEGFAIDPEEI